MPFTGLYSIVWGTCLLLAAAFCALSGILATGVLPSTHALLDEYEAGSAMVFSGLSIALLILYLAASLKSERGKALTLISLATGAGLFLGGTVIRLDPAAAATGNLFALSGALLLLARAASITLLPPRADRRGLMEAGLSLVLASCVAAGWLAVDPAAAGPAFAAALLLSWPAPVDGINAFADAVFHKAALACGARGLRSDCFTRIAECEDIIIDKAAVMSGPDLMVTNVMAFNNEPKTLLAVAASAESESDHPVASALRHLAGQWHVALKTPDRFEPAPGLGVVAILGGQTVVIGTTDLLQKLRIDSFTADAIARSLEADGKTVLRVAVGGRVVGVLGLEGTLRQDAGVAGAILREEGLTPWLYSGDSPKTRAALAGMLRLELIDDPKPSETALEAAERAFESRPALVLTLSADRAELELRSGGNGRGISRETPPLAVSDTDDIGAFPALKALASRRNLLARHARKLLRGIWIAGGLSGGFALVPVTAVPAIFALNIAILWGFARFSVADCLRRPPRRR